MTYRDRRLAKAERLREWAEKREAKAEAASETASRMAGVIPFGQPILVGHYSEGRDRRYRARIGANMDRALEHGRKAQEMASRAEEIERQAAGAIYSDDPDALDRLEMKLAELEAERGRIVAYNKSARAAGAGKAGNVSLLDGRQRDDLAHLVRIGFDRDGAFPSYATSNLSGNIKRTRDRIAQLKGVTS